MLAAGVADASPTRLSLAGEHRLAYASDMPAYADPGFDDSGWRKVVIPVSARRAGVPDSIDVMWFRITFDLPANWDVPHPAIRLGVVQRADETYLNSVRIGGEGTIGPAGTAWHNYPPVTPRLYAFDRRLLFDDRPNVLAVRVARQPYSDEAGILAGPVALVDERAALPAHFAVSQRIRSIDSFLFGLESAVLVALIASVALGLRDRSVLLFACIYSPYYLFRLEQRHFVHALGFDDPALQYVATLLVSTTVIPVIAFAAHVFQRPVGRIGRAIQIGAGLCLFSFPVDGAPILNWWRMHSILLWHVFLALALVLVSWQAIVAARSGRAIAAPLLVGLGAMTVTIVVDICFPSAATESELGLRRGDLGLLAFVLSMGFVAALRLVRMKTDLARAKMNVLVAQEEERNRLARDVHDGIGQWLSAMKLKLEVLNQRLKSSDPAASRRASDLVDDMDAAIEDTRRMAHDLTPMLLEQLGLIGAMRSHGERIGRDLDIDIDIRGESDLGAPTFVAANIYRFFQEALKNALSHSGGGRVRVDLKRAGDRLVLTIEDDGDGLPDARGRSDGFGLQSLTERADLISGTLEIVGRPLRGTKLTLSAPLRP